MTDNPIDEKTLSNVILSCVKHLIPDKTGLVIEQDNKKFGVFHIDGAIQVRQLKPNCAPQHGHIMQLFTDRSDAEIEAALNSERDNIIADLDQLTD